MFGVFFRGEGGSGLKFCIARRQLPSLLVPRLGNEHINEFSRLGSE